MKKFKIGDRVRITNNHGCCAAVGDTGTICNDYYYGGNTRTDYMYGIRLDEPNLLDHSCGGSCEDNRGQNMMGSQLEPIEPNPKQFTVVIRSEGDTTTAKMLYGKSVVREATVTRYHEDEYDEQTAIEAVVAKMFPQKQQTPEPTATTASGHKIQLLVCVYTVGSSSAIFSGIISGDVITVVDGRIRDRCGNTIYEGYTTVDNLNIATGCTFVEIYNSEGKR